MDNLKRLKRLEQLFKEGDSVGHFYIVQQGRMSLYLERSGHKIEVDQVGPGMVLGEQALFGRGRWGYSAEALQETKVMELPLTVMQSQYEAPATSGVIKVLVKGLAEGIRSTRDSLKKMRLDQDNSPCPQVLIPKLFSIIALVGTHSGKKAENGEVHISWTALKIYTARMFLESHLRMESCLQLLTKLGYADLKYVKIEEEDGREELSEVVLRNLETIEGLCEFYQYNLYKGGKAEILYVDDIVHKVIRALAECSKHIQPDFKGSTLIEFNEAVQAVKQLCRIDFKSNHLELLEKKGLFVTRKPVGEKVMLCFDRNELVQVEKYWNIIREIDKWNRDGSVTLHEKVQPEPTADKGNQCPDCKNEIATDQKFCSQCGFKLAA